MRGLMKGTITIIILAAAFIGSLVMLSAKPPARVDVLQEQR